MVARSERKTAIHEAGHAVIGRVLTLPCGPASIKRDHDSSGHAITHDAYLALHEWERRGHFRASGDAVWVARILTYMAGAEAEAEIVGTRGRGDGDDRYQIALMLEQVDSPPPSDLVRYEARLRAMARMLVRRHRDRIERVAAALLAKKALRAKELDRLVGRSVEDVRENAPFLRLMHAQQGKGSPT
jgi:ATP-dependent Zn protease